jgi:hypothetical protein
LFCAKPIVGVKRIKSEAARSIRCDGKRSPPENCKKWSLGGISPTGPCIG